MATGKMPVVIDGNCHAAPVASYARISGARH